MSTALILLSDFQKTEIELWHPIVEAPGYEVSSLGRVRSFIGRKSFGGRVGIKVIRLGTSHLLKTRPDKAGYHYLTLAAPSGQKTFLLHRLVAKAFLDQPLDCDEVNHLNAIKADCRLSNLEWSNHERNHEHATINRLRPSGEKHHWAVLTEAKVREMRALRDGGMGNKEIAARFNMSYYTAWEVTTYQTWKYVE